MRFLLGGIGITIAILLLLNISKSQRKEQIVGAEVIDAIYTTIDEPDQNK